MNLIEQLGGYEAAKGLFNLYEYSISFKYYKVFKGDFESAGYIDVFIPDLQKALPEYRRQHNIFEVGDLVVSKNGCELVSEITYLQGGLAKIKNEKFDHVYSLQDFRHATDEEIKAGKRLEVGS